jgi:hypothetical protein
MTVNRELILRRRIRWMTWFFIVGLIISGVTAIPLPTEIDWLTKLAGISDLAPEQATSGFAKWLLKVRDGLRATDANYPFIFYGMDWLAFGHIIIAIAFIGALRDPVRNVWLFDFGMIACILVIPWALIFGALRGIPLGWRLIDCSFGVFGIIPLWVARRWVNELSRPS